MGLMTVMAGFGRGEGLGVEAQLPLGVIASSDVVNGTRRDVGLGDLEARARGTLRVGHVRLQGMAGVALPTGAYSSRSGADAILENARYLTLGRGTTWALVDVDARASFPSRFGGFLSATGRLAMADTRDGFRWGPEVRTTAGVTFGPLAERLSFAAGLELQVRAQSSELDAFTNERTASVNTGGAWLTLTPSAQLRVVDGVSVFASARVPLAQRTEGLQFVPAAGVFAGVAGSFEVIAPPVPAKPTVDRAPVPGKVTVVDYWASWCEPCRRVAPQVHALERAGVSVKRVDVTSASQDDLEQVLPGVPGLPVIEVFRADGTLAVRLVGADVFRITDVVKEVSP